MTSRDRTQRFKELRRLYKPHSIKIKEFSTYLRSAATNISHRANAKFSKSKLAQKLRINDPYDSDDSQEGQSLLKHSSTRNNNDSDNDSSSSSSDDEKKQNKQSKLPKKLIKSLQTKPLWLQLLHDIDSNTIKIRNQLGILKETHRSRLRIQFDDDLYVSQDIKIEELTKSITALFHSSHSKLKHIALDVNVKEGGDHISQQLRINAMKSRGVKIQELTSIFRYSQRMFLQKLKEREKRGSRFIQFGDDNKIGFNKLGLNLDKIEQGLTKKELLKLELYENNCDKRTKEIINISKSVSELAVIFRDLGVLIIEQGDILDRIDYNVEQTLDRFTSSHKHIQKAEKYQKKSGTTVVILILLGMIALCLIILILKLL